MNDRQGKNGGNAALHDALYQQIVNRLPNLTHHRHPILTLSSDEFGR